jgi:ABC-type sugar transport system substrate-binding protein
VPKKFIQDPKGEYMMITRRKLLVSAAAGAAAASFGSRAFAAAPPLAKKDTYKVGFAQTESNNPWRLAQTKSMQDEAAKRGWQLVYTDAAGSAAKQVADVNSMIAQQVDLIFLAPREEVPLMLDRNVAQDLAKPGEDYVCFIGSNFIEEGQRIAEYLVGMKGDKKTIIELEGTVGSSPANDRKKGFDEVIAKNEGYTIVASQSGDFARDKGRQVAETLLQAHPEANVIYAHNDEMAIGAIAALEAAGRKAGRDDCLVFSIDGGKEIVQLVVDGKVEAVVECNPRFGPKAFDTAVAYANGETIPPVLINPDEIYTPENAAQLLGSAY